jgi:glutamate dehydrogenase
MVSPASSLQSLPDVHVNGNEPNKLPVRSAPKLYGSNDGASSGTGTPIGFQRQPHNKILDSVAGSNVRMPSPQPTHLAIPGSPHRVLSEEDPGYIAAKFEGKEHQMEEGELFALGSRHISNRWC